MENVSHNTSWSVNDSQKLDDDQYGESHDRNDE